MERNHPSPNSLVALIGVGVGGVAAAVATLRFAWLRRLPNFSWRPSPAVSHRLYALWGVTLAGCFGVRLGVGPNVDTLGHVGFDVKLQVNAEIPTREPGRVPLAFVNREAVPFFGVVAGLGGGMSTRHDQAGTAGTSSQLIGYAGLGVNYLKVPQSLSRPISHRLNLVGGRRQFFGYSESDSKGMVALQYSAAFPVWSVKAALLTLGPELQTELQFDGYPEGLRTSGIFSLSLFAELYGLIGLSSSEAPPPPKPPVYSHPPPSAE